MRLHALEFTGIGPFRERQVIDFDRLAGSGLFLIDGPTGAGKTTIIDAIVFALYGDVSGREADDSRLRSDYSLPSEPSEVICEFSVGDRRIWIKRTPRFLRPKLKGEGTTQVAATQLLRELDRDGHVRAELTHASEIGARVAALMGMSAQQFRQLVVLPQGEFADLLRMKPLDRFTALGPLLGDAFYRRLQDDLELDGAAGRARVTEAAVAVHDAQQRLMGALGDLDDEAAAEQRAVLAADDTAAAGRVEAAQAIVDWILGQQSAYAEVVDALEPRVAALRQQVDRLDEDAEAMRRHERDVQMRDEALAALGAEAAHLERAEAAGLLAQLQQGKGRLEPWIAWEADADARVHRRTALVQAHLDAVAEAEQAEEERASLPERRRRLQSELTARELLAATGAQQAAEVERLTELQAALVDLAAQEVQARAVSTALTSATDRAGQADRAVAERTAQFEELLVRQLHARAGVLAQALAAGRPCPVCGSIDHPAKASGGDAGVSDDELAAHREELDAMRERAQQLRIDREAAAAQMREIEGRVMTLRGALADRQAPELVHDIEVARQAWQAATDAASAVPALMAELRELDAWERSAQQRQQGLAAAVSGLLTELAVLDAAEEQARTERAAILGSAPSAAELTREWDEQISRLQAFTTADEAAAASRAALPVVDESETGADRAPATRAALEQAQEQLDIARLALGQFAHAGRAAAQPLAELRSAVESERVARDETAAAIALADAVTAARGSINRRRLTLQSYAVQRRFAAVLDAASLHLGRMSAGKYSLALDDQAHGNAQGGLGIKVHDAWTGQQRDPRSLSGGETFYTALSLALGLADVVRDEVGGTQLETLFVDEGFGSLDQESLQLVLEQLDALRTGGRVVGVVSHVTEMKEWVRERIDVIVGQDRTSSIALMI